LVLSRTKKYMNHSHTQVENSEWHYSMTSEF
jgi:hypothetical protein